jgi:Ca2+-binding EF-hand superfamily protein
MNRNELKSLQSIKEYPSVSILMPTHRLFPENQQDPIRLKNLVKLAETRLLAEFSKPEVKIIIEKINAIIDEIDFNHLLDGLAIFVNRKFSRKYLFQFPVKERAAVDSAFLTRDIVFAINRTQPYYVLVLGDKMTRIFNGVRDNLNEIVYNGFPVHNKFRQMLERADEIHTNDRLSDNIEKKRNYFREVEKEFKKLNVDSHPFALAGVEENIGTFKDTITINNLLTSLKGSYDKTSASELAKLIWPEVKKGFAEIREKVLKQLEEAISSKKAARGIDEVWKAANEGRGEILLVEINYQYPAKLEKIGLQLIPVEPNNGPEIMDDAVDEVIEIVLNKGGKVYFVENGKLEEKSKIALILRY